jgi:uncharacterized repeat protein (TIGR01451 family)
VITNTATVSFTDANSNTYASVQASVNVTVGFQAGIDVTAGAATASPASPSTDNDLTFDIDNIGNGVDSVTASVNISDSGVITNVRYILGVTTYPSLAALNTALAGTAVAAGGTLTVTVRYDVPSGQGGNPSTLTFTATSRRDAGESDSDATIVTPPITGTISVTPDGGQGLEHLPSNGTQYLAVFSVTNGQTGTDDLDLTASSDNGHATIVSVNGVAGSTTQVTFTSGETKTINVIYTVADVAAGTTDNVRLLAASAAVPATNDEGYFDYTVIRPSLSITKEAWDDTQSAQIAGDVFPGDFIQYKVIVENTGSAAAETVSVTDALPAAVAYQSTAGDGGSPSWGLSEAGGTVTGTLTTLAAGATRFFWIRVQIR